MGELTGLAAWEAAMAQSYGGIQQSIGMAYTAEELVCMIHSFPVISQVPGVLTCVARF